MGSMDRRGTVEGKLGKSVKGVYSDSAIHQASHPAEEIAVTQEKEET